MVSMKMGETTKWSNIAFGRAPLKLPTNSMPNVHLTTFGNSTKGSSLSNALNNQRYRTELSLNIADYSYISKRAVSFLHQFRLEILFEKRIKTVKYHMIVLYFVSTKYNLIPFLLGLKLTAK